MIGRSLVAAATCLGLGGIADAAIAPAVRAVFEAAWTRAQCSEPLENALNGVHYEELGGGYSLGLVLCRVAVYQQSHLLFLVAPRTGGRPQLLQFEDWIDHQFRRTDVLFTAGYDARSRLLSSLMKGSDAGDCGRAGEWTWTGTHFELSGYWNKPDCDGEAFDRDERYRVFPPR